ncbi:MAG: twin-arginine translocase subunit TatC [Deltaproteobacteria bacterium]|nr:twin-arginine translocase subunit TatC [Deltaproteobacteria bacterium]
MLKWKMPPVVELLTALRKRIIVTAVAVVIGMGIAWSFSPALMSFVEKPLTGQTYLTDMKTTVYQVIKERYPSIYDSLKLDKDLLSTAKDRKLNYSTPLEPFFIQCKISLIAGLFLVLPVVLYQVWLVMAPRLGRRGKRMAIPFVLVGTGSFVVGAAFFLLFIWPVIINFSLSYEAEGLQSWFNLSAYVNFCLRLILIFGLIFELPVLSMLLARLGIINHGLMARNRKYALLASAVIAAFHADLLTMIVIMVPLYAMYEVSVWVTLLAGKKQISVSPA